MSTQELTLHQQLRQCAKDEAAYEKLVELFKQHTRSYDTLTSVAVLEHRYLPADYDLDDVNILARIAAEFLPGGVVTIVDTAMKYRFVGGYSLERFGYSPANMIGKHPQEVLPPQVAGQFIDGYQRALNGEWINSELSFAGNTYLFRHRPVFYEEGRVALCVSVSQDITHYTKLQDELRASEERYRSLFEGNQAIITISDPETLRVVDANQAASEFYGYSRDEFRGMPITKFNMTAEQTLRENMREVFNQNRKYFQFVHKKASGEIRDVELYTAVVNVNGRDLTYSIIHDITERKRMEQELIENQRLTRNITETVPYMIYVYDVVNSRNVYINSRVSELLGYTREEIDQMDGSFILSLMHPDDVPATVKHYHDTISAKNSDVFEIEYRVQHKNGQWRILFSRDRIFERDADGKPLTIIGVMQDVTGTRTIERALREYDARYRQVLQHLPNTGILMFNHELRILLAEGALLERLGLNKALLEDRRIMNALPPEMVEAWIASCEVALMGKSMHRVAEVKGRFLDEHFAPLLNNEGEVTAGMAIFYDVTENRKVAEHVFQIRIQREKMQLLTSFITSASHEFRTPLSIINSSVFLMERAPDKEAMNRQARKIEAQVEQISSLVDSLALMTALDAAVGFQLSQHSFNEIVGDVLTTLHPQIVKHEHVVDFSAPDSPYVVRGDGNMLYRAVLEIVGNAIRFTPDGGHISIRLEPEPDDRIMLTVADNGVGIPDESLPHIFDRFYRADVMRTTAGFGLGLPIARAIIERHHGKLNVESTVGVGTKFEIMLPMEPLSMSLNAMLD